MIRTAETWWPALTGDHDLLVVGAGVLCLLFGVVVWLWWRRGAAHTRIGTVAVVLATLFAAEGMWEVARLSLHLNVIQSIALFALFEVVMVHQGLSARYKMRLTNPRPIRRHLNIIWAVAAASGVVSSLRADNAAEFAVRLFAPLVAAMIFWMDLTADKDVVDPGSITWRFKPRDLAVRLGLADPGEHGVVEADQRRRLDTMALLAHRLHNSRLEQKTRDKLVAKLAKLSLNASDATLAEVQRRVSRASKAEHLTRPDILEALTVDAAARTAPAANLPVPAAADLTVAVPMPATDSTVAVPVPASDLTAVAVPASSPASMPVDPPTSTPVDPTTSAPTVAVPVRPPAAPARSTGPALPRKAGSYRQWLQIWQSMQADPSPTNKVLAAGNRVSERTITAIRAAGRGGLLSPERLRDLEAAEGVAAPSAVATVGSPATSSVERPAWFLADRLSPQRGAAAKVATTQQTPAGERTRDVAMVGR